MNLCRAHTAALSDLLKINLRSKAPEFHYLMPQNVCYEVFVEHKQFLIQKSAKPHEE